MALEPWDKAGRAARKAYLATQRMLNPKTKFPVSWRAEHWRDMWKRAANDATLQACEKAYREAGM